MHHDELLGRVGRVTGAVRPEHFGEVMLSRAGRTEAYYAKPFDEVETRVPDRRQDGGGKR